MTDPRTESLVRFANAARRTELELVLTDAFSLFYDDLRTVRDGMREIEQVMSEILFDEREAEQPRLEEGEQEAHGAQASWWLLHVLRRGSAKYHLLYKFFETLQRFHLRAAFFLFALDVKGQTLVRIFSNKGGSLQQPLALNYH